MLYREIIAFCSEIHTKHVNVIYGMNVEFFNAKPGGELSIHFALKGTMKLKECLRTYCSLNFPKVVSVQAEDLGEHSKDNLSQIATY